MMVDDNSLVVVPSEGQPCSMFPLPSSLIHLATDSRREEKEDAGACTEIHQDRRIVSVA
jgi:hypothetical protein